MAVQDLTRIREYYDETWHDYRLLWLNPSNYAIHFGYWDAAPHNHPEALNRLNAVLASRIGIRPGARVLDAGCGVGGSAIWLAKNVDAQVVGITPVASQVERARRFAGERGVADQVQFFEQDYTRTSFPAGSFDVVWAVESVCHAADKRAFYLEARRLLRPGGRLGMVEYMQSVGARSPHDQWDVDVNAIWRLAEQTPENPDEEARIRAILSYLKVHAGYEPERPAGAQSPSASVKLGPRPHNDHH